MIRRWLRRAPGRGVRPAVRALAGVTAAAAFVAAAGCAARSPASGPPLDDPAGVARRLTVAAAPAAPTRLRFHWEYADERGPTRGDGVGRYNPPDSLRLDLFGPGDHALAVALAGGRLRSEGELRDLRLPPPAYLYATAGLFRPDSARPERGFTDGEDRILVYDVPNGAERRYVVRRDRLVRVEDVQGGQVLRRLEITWPEGRADWPEGAEYRDRVFGSRARWSLEEATSVDEPYASDIFDLPSRG